MPGWEYWQAERRFKFIHLRNSFFGKEHMGLVQWMSLTPSSISARKLRAGGGAEGRLGEAGGWSLQVFQVCLQGLGEWMGTLDSWLGDSPDT